MFLGFPLSLFLVCSSAAARARPPYSESYLDLPPAFFLLSLFLSLFLSLHNNKKLKKGDFDL